MMEYRSLYVSEVFCSKLFEGAEAEYTKMTKNDGDPSPTDLDKIS
jgi:hypothetical protein